MNKRTLKMLKHFVHVHGHGPVVTLYRGGKGDVLSVEALLKDHFGSEAVLPKVNYFTHTFTELAPPKAKAKGKGKNNTNNTLVLLSKSLTNFSFSAPIGNATSHYPRERTTSTPDLPRQENTPQQHNDSQTACRNVRKNNGNSEDLRCNQKRSRSGYESKR